MICFVVELSSHLQLNQNSYWGAMTFVSRLMSTSVRSTTRDKINLTQIYILSLARYRIGGPAAPQTPLLSWGAEAPTWPPPARKRALPERRGNMMSNHTCSDRLLPTCKTTIVVIATIFTLLKVNAKQTTKEVPRCGGGKRPPPLYIGFE